MNNTKYEKRYLANGVRVVSENIPTARTVSLGVWVDVGSRDETLEEAGICHFLEHMLFKGTPNRTARKLACDIDELGGEVNAFTTKEHTVFYMRLPGEFVFDGIALLADMFLNSLFEEAEIEKEKLVVKNEIRMAEDDPEDLVDELHSKNIWGEQPLGRPILGKAENVLQITRDDLVNFFHKHFTPENIVISVVGCFDKYKLIQQLEGTFGQFKRDLFIKETVVTPFWNAGRLDTVKELEQVQLGIGVKGMPVTSEQRYILYIFSSLLGGSVSSRLFQEIREERGLAYSIYSEIVSYRDIGQLNVFAISQREHTEEVLGLTLFEIDKILKNGISQVELDNAKSLLRSDVVFELESLTRRMSSLAGNELCLGKYVKPEEILKNINKVSKDDVEQLAGQLFGQKNFTITTLGPQL